MSFTPLARSSRITALPIGAGLSLALYYLLAITPNAGASEGSARTVSAKPASTIGLSTSDLSTIETQLKLTLKPTGVLHPWTFRILNTSSHPIEVIDDVTQFWMSVTLPGSSTSKTCRLPEELQQAMGGSGEKLVLPPGAHVDRNIDPRLFCFSVDGQTHLVPGALVRPHFGAPSGAAARVKNPEKPRDARDSRSFGGPEVLLGDLYSAWTSSTAGQVVANATESQPLKLTLIAGSDAKRARAVTVTLMVSNPSSSAQPLTLRQESIEYRVSGPAGEFVCPAVTATRPPFDTMRPGSSQTFTTLLSEVCPRLTFAAPGLYQVTAILPAAVTTTVTTTSNSSNEVSAPLTGARPVLVRLQQGIAATPREKPGRLLTPAVNQSSKSIREPSRPTRRNRPGGQPPIPKVDLLE